MLQYKKGTDYAEIVSGFFKRIGRIFTFAKAGAKLKGKGAMYAVQGGKAKSASPDEKQKKIDKILDKISHSGYDALTKEEKDFLFKSSKQQ